MQHHHRYTLVQIVYLDLCKQGVLGCGDVVAQAGDLSVHEQGHQCGDAWMLGMSKRVLNRLGDWGRWLGHYLNSQ